METLENKIIRLQIKNNKLEDEIETITKELKEKSDKLWNISKAMDEGIHECMDAEDCWARACAIANGEDEFDN
tara:strand:+ start:661 stop:879 length:219 start_codon:yes stop_codon:yes gene_type:complete